MDIIILIVQWIVGLGILNVWLLRANKATEYRAGNAPTMRQEFEVYGLPVWFMYAIGTAKVVLALALLAGTWIPGLVQPASIGLSILMGGAVAMHLKIKDTLKHTLPSIIVLLLCLFLVIA